MDSQRAKPRIMNQSFWLLGGWPKRADGDMVFYEEEGLGVKEGDRLGRRGGVHRWHAKMVLYGTGETREGEWRARRRVIHSVT